MADLTMPSPRSGYIRIRRESGADKYAWGVSRDATARQIGDRAPDCAAHSDEGSSISSVGHGDRARGSRDLIGRRSRRWL